MSLYTTAKEADVLIAYHVQELIRNSPNPRAMLTRWIAGDADNDLTSYLLNVLADLNSGDNHWDARDTLVTLTETVAGTPEARAAIAGLPAEVARLGDAIQGIEDRDPLELIVRTDRDGLELVVGSGPVTEIG